MSKIFTEENTNIKFIKMVEKSNNVQKKPCYTGVSHIIISDSKASANSIADSLSFNTLIVLEKNSAEARDYIKSKGFEIYDKSKQAESNDNSSLLSWDEYIKKNPMPTNMPTSGKYEKEAYAFAWTFDKENGKLTITPTADMMYINKVDISQWSAGLCLGNFLKNYRLYVREISMPAITIDQKKISVGRIWSQNSAIYNMNDMLYLEKLTFASTNFQFQNVTFKNCPNLKTLGREGIEDGAIDFTNIIFLETPPKNSSESCYVGVHRFCELIYTISGENKITYGSKTVNEFEKCLRFVPKTNVPIEYNIENIKFGEFIGVYFDMDTGFSEEVMCISVLESDKIKNLFEKLLSAWTSKGVGYYEKSMSILYDIIRIVKRCSNSNYIPKSKYDIINPAVTYIHEHWSDIDFDFSVLPSLCGIGYTYYRQLFIFRFGMPPKKYLTAIRIKNACEMLEAGMQSIKDISEAVGYTDECYFSRFFKKQMGVSPREYIITLH